MTEALRSWRMDWPGSRGRRPGQAVLKACPEDFRVDEVLDRLADESEVDDGNVAGGKDGQVSGAGEHLCLRLRKSGDNTEYVARELAALAGCRDFDVGFCGLKDRNAVTTQWFSLYRPGMEAADAELVGQVSARWPVLAACRDRAKLRRGDHQGNRFEITLTEVQGDRAEIEAALHEVAAVGVPNYFGRQRFGHGGANLERAIGLTSRTLSSRKKRGRNRNAARDAMYFSAARSWLFNEVLARRVVDGSWNRILEGEPGSSSPPGATGPLWGDGGTRASGAQGELEFEVVNSHPLIAAVFASTRMAPERRPLVLQPVGLSWQWLAADRLVLRFGLAPGEYATALLEDVFELREPAKDQSALADDA